MKLDKDYWQSRYESSDTPWDTGEITPPLKAYLDTLNDKSLYILIPGAGRAYEALYLHNKGFTNVFVCDWAQSALDHVTSKAPDFPAEHLLCQDFFTLPLKVDIILEQTFFCALNPDKRLEYAEKAHSLLLPGGVLAGLFFASPFGFPGPPFGGTKAEYIEIFQPLFHIEVMEECRNSIRPRLGNELFFKMVKR